MRVLKILLKAIGWIVAIVIVIAVAVSLFFDVNKYKPQIENAVAKSTGMTLKINGKASLKLFPRVHLALRDVHLFNRGSELFAAKEVRAAPRVFPFVFHHEIIIDKVSLDTPKIQIEKSPSGDMNFQFAGAAGSPGQPGKPAQQQQGQIKSVSVNNGDISYRDRGTGQTAHLQGVDLDLSDVVWKGQDFALHGNVKARSLKSGNLNATDLQARLRDEHGLIRLDPTEFNAFGGKIRGSLKADLRGRTPKIELKQNASNIDLAQALAKAQGKISGTANATLDLHASGKTPNALLRSADGAISMRSTNFATSIPIDELAAKLKSGNVMNLVQLGSSLFLHGAGTPPTQAAGTAPQAEAKKTQGTLVSDWKISNGTAETQNVALSTGKTTIAFKGDVNLVNKRYENFYVASVDPSGCALRKVQVEGPLTKPRPVASSVAQGLAEQELQQQLGRVFPGAVPSEAPEQSQQGAAPVCDRFVDPQSLRASA